MSRFARFIRRERGAAVLEFALIAPIFFLLVVGILMFSRGYQRLNALNSALREGARMASTQSDPWAQRNAIKARMLTFSSAFGFGIDTSRVSITPSVSPAPAGTTTVTVSVTNYTLFSGLNFLGTLQNVQVSRTASFRWEYGP